ncbi:hypothetical protein LPTSP2_39070 [Leptospira ellinghausenii]|uniref:DUF4917 domain-containing protein n=1 Tax=Leptospira ellinghausenii TaxID=1917822 RepID=A0A2P2DJ14_9LEPT|nr:DUF4917 family protein [Leptospira ellinghausenii]GBF44604.1 hypothetical protein LPTSP2_39070 [Leptospira ellinghausenii]
MKNLIEWSENKNDFNQSVILGNGASIAIDSAFSYSSLFAKAKELQNLNEDLEKIFDHFETKDFEFVLRMLWHATKINETLSIEEEKTQVAYKTIKNALIQSVQNNHPKQSKIDYSLPNITNFLSNFSEIYSLNYDLLIYWSILLGNEKTKNRFKDCFISSEFKSDWENLKEPYGEAKKSTLVFYPHGNLALETNIMGIERKVKAKKNIDLLETIFDRWNKGDSIPLFVSEGLSNQKLNTIKRSNYLAEIYYNAFSKISGNLLIYGWSLSEQDTHLIKTLNKDRINKICISIFTGNSNYIDEIERIEKVLKKQGFNEKDISFVDSSSKSLWIY